MLGLLAERLALLRTVDAAEADAFSTVVVQDFEGVAIEDGACELCNSRPTDQSTQVGYVNR